MFETSEEAFNTSDGHDTVNKNKRSASDELDSEPTNTDPVSPSHQQKKLKSSNDETAVSSVATKDTLGPASEKQPTRVNKQRKAKAPRAERAKSGVVNIKMLQKSKSTKVSSDVVQLFDSPVSVGGGQSAW